MKVRVVHSDSPSPSRVRESRREGSSRKDAMGAKEEYRKGKDRTGAGPLRAWQLGASNSESENPYLKQRRKGIKVKQDLEDNWRILRLWHFLGLRPKLEA